MYDNRMLTLPQPQQSQAGGGMMSQYRPPGQGLVGQLPPRPGSQYPQMPNVGHGGWPPGFQSGPANSFGDPYNVYLSTVPIFQQEAKRNIQGAMGQAGLTGNRFSSSAQRQAGQIGADTAQRQQGLLQNLLYGQANQDLDRALQATMHGGNLGLQASLGMGNLALQSDQMSRQRAQDLFEVARWEQERADRYPLLRWQDFNQSRMGFIPLLMQLAGSQGAGSQGSPITTTTGGSPGLIDLAGFAANTFPMWGPAAFPNFFKSNFG